jgi:hypothetical protein
MAPRAKTKFRLFIESLAGAFTDAQFLSSDRFVRLLKTNGGDRQAKRIDGSDFRSNMKLRDCLRSMAIFSKNINPKQDCTRFPASVIHPCHVISG